MPSDNAGAFAFRELWRANRHTTRARVDTALRASMGTGESVETCSFGALLPNRASEVALTYMTRKGLVGGLSMIAVHAHAVPLVHIVLTTTRVLVFTDRPLRLAWAYPRMAVSAEFKHGRSGWDGILRVRRSYVDTVTRLHVVGDCVEGATDLAAALPAQRETAASCLGR